MRRPSSPSHTGLNFGWLVGSPVEVTRYVALPDRKLLLRQIIERSDMPSSNRSDQNQLESVPQVVSSPPLDQVFAAVRHEVELATAEALGCAEGIKNALDGYLWAVERHAVVGFAERLGVALPARTGPLEAARALLLAVGELPELRLKTPVAGTVVATGGALSAPIADAADGQRPRPRPFRLPTPEVRALFDEVNASNLEAMAVPLFRATASEFAARARVLTDRGDEEEDIPGRIIRRLTAIASSRGEHIYGLARHHKANWEHIAEGARTQRLRTEATECEGLTHKLPLPSSAQIAETAVEEDDDDNEEALDHYPHLRAAARGGAVVLVGGVRKCKKLDALKRRLGLDVEWIATDASGTSTSQNLAERISRGSIAAVVVLHGLIGHRHYEPLIEAARQARMPVGYGKTAGTASLAKAFAEIEAQLAQRS